MASEPKTKINSLLRIWPIGTVAATSWLEDQDIYHQLATDYQKSAWIKRIGHGAFIRDGDQVSWQGGLYAIQKHLRLPIHAAAKTALELHGIVHFVPTGLSKVVHLFGAPRAKLPTWFRSHDWNINLRFTATSLFSEGANQLGLAEKTVGAFSIQCSSRERAILELLHLIPYAQGFEEAKLLFESLRTLRPDLLQALLQNCHSIKVKRLFLYFADLTNQPWLQDLELTKIELGKGKRVIGEGGVFDPKYNISVPKISTGGDANELEGA
jgi:hypothetical protein